MTTDETTGQRVSVQSLYYTYKKKEVVCTQKRNDVIPRPSRPSDPERRGSLQKISRLSVFSPTVLEEQLLALTNPLGMRDARCKVNLALRLAECCIAEEFMSDNLDSRSVSLSRGIPAGKRLASRSPVDHARRLVAKRMICIQCLWH